MLIIKRFAAGVILLAVVNFILFNPLIFCNENETKRNKSHSDVPLSNIDKGHVLAQQYCQSCHLLPDPSLLDAVTWEKGVLPVMGPYLGVFNLGFKSYPSRKRDPDLIVGFYPQHPLVTQEQWAYIIDYFTSVSLDTLLSNQSRLPIQNSTSLFSVETPTFTHGQTATTFIKIADEGKQQKLVYFDATQKTLYRCEKSLNPVDSLKIQGAVVDIKEEKDKWLLCNIGIMQPNNGKRGSAQYAEIKNGKLRLDTTFLTGLQRPVQIEAVDFDRDGNTDYLVCEFGFLTGALSWMRNKGNGTFERKVLRPLPGAIKAYIDDYNKDGLPDIWVLFAQGEEGIFLYTNKGNGEFKEEQLLRFPPVYGSSYFEMADFNNDGFKDIVYTCGDNADYSPILKPYHGVYIFLNDGTNHFRQKYFYPINGCFKAIARDFDRDGDLDIATISYFADYINHPEEGFVYLENKGNFTFQPYSIPGTQAGRWLTMDANDIDGDGNIDIVLGNFSIGPTLMKPKADWKKGPPFLVLKNKGPVH